ncbi:hypothetical protein EYV94_28035 [Puteibacter caeruleilacunae]|nr:hypothetical protein EYV94_28035 [Puteibacter caeruleilacunae]
MKRNSNIIILAFCSVLMGCVTYKSQMIKGIGDIESARKNVIIDCANTYKMPRNYFKERKGKRFDIFWVFNEESKDDLLVFSVSPEIDGHITLGIKDSIGKVPCSYFPNNYEIKNGKLFVWNDGITPLRRDVLDAVNNFGVLDSTDVKRELGLLPDDFEDTRVVRIDHRLKSIHYYVCRNRIEKYKKVGTNRAFGYYNTPKLNCNTQY